MFKFEPVSDSDAVIYLVEEYLAELHHSSTLAMSVFPDFMKEEMRIKYMSQTSSKYIPLFEKYRVENA